MIYLLIILSLLFAAIGFILTESNAKYLLSGYNTMSEEDRKKVNIQEYIRFFRRFHIFLGVSFLVVGAALIYYISETAGGIFLGVYPILAYIYFILSSTKYSTGLSTKLNKVSAILLLGTLILVVGMFGYGLMENKLSFDNEIIKFNGIYGETLTPSDLISIKLVNELPRITLRTNGFVLGTIKKGHFRIGNGDVVKLILNSDNKPYILFTKADGRKIYYSAKEGSNVEIVSELKMMLPEIEFL